jgi:HAD superfamily hydrolase (TIGR01490 family)
MHMNGFLDTLPDADIAFFDLDETITDADTDGLWASWRSRRDVRGWAERVWLVKLYRDFRGGRLRIDSYMKYQRFRIGTLAPDRFRAMGKEFFNESGRGHIYPDARELIAAFRKAGCMAVLLTAQNEYIAGPFAEYLMLDGMIANRFETDGPMFTNAVRPYSFGDGKVVLGRRFADKSGVPLTRCAFFGDSIHDAPFLEAVGHPYAVNPDPLLEARARHKSWPIVRFSRAPAN